MYQIGTFDLLKISQKSSILVVFMPCFPGPRQQRLMLWKVVSGSWKFPLGSNTGYLRIDTVDRRNPANQLIW